MLTKSQSLSILDGLEEEAAAEFRVDVETDDALVLGYAVVQPADVQGADLREEQGIIVTLASALERAHVAQGLEDVEVAEVILAENIEAEALEVAVEPSRDLGDLAFEYTFQWEGHGPVFVFLNTYVIAIVQAISVT